MAWRQDLGKQIREARDRLGLTQGDLVKGLSIKRAELSNYENGKVRAPSLYAIVELAKALATPLRIDGYVVTPDQRLPEKARILKQLCIEFDKEHSLEGTTLKIRPTKAGIIITGVAQSIRRA
jgi:transcriptional regulator with XRE-family HTH domain